MDTEMRLVVVAMDCQGECLAQAVHKHGVTDARSECDCMWEDLEPDAAITAK